MRRPRVEWVLAGVMLGASAGLVAQRGGQVFRGRADLVSLSVTVTDAADHLVGGLDQASFQVFEDGAPQQVSMFSREPTPISASILFDTSTSMEHKLGIAQEAATGFVERLRPTDTVQILTFASHTQILQEFTNDEHALTTAIQRAEVGGSTAVYDALYIALTALRKVRAQTPDEVRRQTIVLLSDGEDTSSLKDYEGVLDLSKRSEVTVYAIGLRDPGYHPLNRRFNEADYVLRTISRETGGRVFFVTDISQLPSAYQQIAEELANQYTDRLRAHQPENGRHVAAGDRPCRRAGDDRPDQERLLRADGAALTDPARVFLIGAGPGDPGLLSARGVRLLAEADVVVYDRAAEPLLRWARPETERIDVGSPAERGPAQDAISLLLAEKARDGLTVARLKWGDPFVFDSGAKEAIFLHEQGLAFEVVPGVPAGLGAAAYAGVPLTYPGSGDALVFLRGHEGASDATPTVDWRALGQLDATLVCYAGGRQAAAILQALRAHGAPADRPAVLIYNGTMPTQRTITGTIGGLADEAGDDAEPGILIVGNVASLRDHLRWYDQRPLFGRRIVVTRSREGARELVELLENLGAQAIEAPTFRLSPPEDPEELERLAASVDAFDWVVFESANSVGRLLSAVARGPRDLRALGQVSICAIGASTTDRLLAHGIKPDVVVPEFRPDAVAEALSARRRLDRERVLVVHPDHERDVLAAELARHGAIVTDLVAYRTEGDPPDSPAAQELYRMLLDGRIDAVTFTSPSAVGRFSALIGQEQAADLLNTTTVAAIGPVTAAAAAELGINVSVVPLNYTMQGLVDALVDQFKRQDR